MMTSVEELVDIAKDIRRESLKLIHQAGSGHPGGSLSATDLLAALYFRVMNYDSKKPDLPSRDRFVLSKGHCTGLLYTVLAKTGYIPQSSLSEYRKIDSSHNLSGHPHPNTPGVEIATGSLGQGMSVANGIALASRLDGISYRVFVLLGDGELQEGQVWEAAMSAAKFKSSNLTAIVDYNKVAQDNLTRDLKDLEPLDKKWESFGWDVVRIDGHDMGQIVEALERAPHEDKPRVVIADTIKGKGVSFMENKTAWHGVAPNDEQLTIALKELA